MRRFRPLLLFVVVSLAGSGCALWDLVEREGRLFVSVLDGSGEPMPGILVTLDWAIAPAGLPPRRSDHTDEYGGVVFRHLGGTTYRVVIGNLPEYPLFDVTEAEIGVGPTSDEFVEFRALPDGGLDVLTSVDGPLGGVLVELVDAEGATVGVDRTGSGSGSGRATFSPLRRGLYEIRLSDVPSWAIFDPLSMPVDLLANCDVHLTLEGSIDGDRVVEARVTVDGAPLEGVGLEGRMIKTGDRIAGRTDAEGVARWTWEGRGADVYLTDFDQQRYTFPAARLHETLPQAPGVTTISFEGTLATGGPVAAILAPTDGSVFAQGAEISFAGVSNDPEDGSLPAEAHSWASDLDGDLGDGDLVVRSDLSLGTHTVTLTATDSDGNTGQASITITVGENRAPSVSIESPTGGTSAIRGDPVSFRGSGDDPEEGLLTGASLEWTSDVDGAIGTGVGFDRSDLSVGSHVVTLTATDGSGSSGTASVSFEILENLPPTVVVADPTDGAVVSEGAPVQLTGTATDPEDGMLTGSALVWTSDVDGVLGTGASAQRDDLTVGVHTVTLTATDRLGRSASASVSLRIDAVPTVTITQPLHLGVYQSGAEIPFNGSAVDPEDGDLTGPSLVWSSSLDGVLGTGPSLSRSDLTVGSHVIRLTATDRDGATGSAEVWVTVEGTGDATIRGRVELPGMPLPGVTVTAAGPTFTQTVTDAQGEYVLTGLPPGTYEVWLDGLPAGAVFDPTSTVVTIAAGQEVVLNWIGSTGG